MSGKGSGRRPQQESDEIVAARWDAIFGNKNQPPEGEQPEQKEIDDER